jgi:WD40 repeat protein/serine/threonine protein kinase
VVLTADRDLSGCTLGRYRLHERIGAGGFGTVYRGEQPQLGRDVVVKVLHEQLQLDDDALRRFLREARLASRLDHPYAAHVYAFGVEDEDGLAWIAMELVQGVTLKHWLATHGPMTLEQFVPFFERIAEVVQAAHERGIVHRDLKPSNVMVIEGTDGLIPKLLDFGIAKSLPAAPAGVVRARMRATPPLTPSDPVNGPAANNGCITPSNAVMGSWPYMPPEQWWNYAVGPAADTYALGVLAYEALTGQLPFFAETRDEYLERHFYGYVPGVGWSALDRIFQRALAKFPKERHGSVLELASELRAVLRASQGEQLRSSAQRWEDRGRPPGLLWGGDMLADLEVPSDGLGEPDCSFVAASWRGARRVRWLRRSLVALAVMIVFGVFQYRAAMQTRMAEQQAALQTRLAQEQTRSAQQVAEATVTQAELEQGRSALLHGEPEAPLHLGRAYHRGDHSPSTAFMLARALQPKLAEQARFASSFGRMWSAAFSPDGRQIVTTDDRGAQVRDAQSYRLLFELPHGDTVYQAVYSADGTRLVTAGGDGAVRIWDAASGALVRALRRDGTKPRYYVVALSPDGKLVAAIDTKGEVADIWDVATGAPIAEIRNDASEFPAIAFSSDGHWLATTGGNDVRVFDARTRAQAITIRGPGIHSLAFDPTGPRLITGAATGDAAIWAIPSGARIRHLRDVGEPVDAVAFSPDGQLVVAASRDGAAHVWHARSGELQSQFNPRHSKILAVEFDRSSKLVLAAGADGTVVVADAALGMPVTVLEGPQNLVRVAHFDPSSRRVVGASKDGTARVWDATSPYRRWGSSPMSDDCGRGTSAESDGRFIAVDCRDHPTRVWDTSRDLLLAELPSVSHVEGDFSSAFPAVSAAGDRAAIARGNTVEVYELPGGRLLHTIAHGAPVNAVAFARTGRDIISGAVDGSMLVTRDNGALLALPTSASGIDAVAFLPDGRVVAADAQRRLRVYDPGGAVLADLEIPMRVMSLRIDGPRLVTVPIVPLTADVAPPLLLDVDRYRVIAQLEGHLGRVFSARWVAGHQILTAGSDGTVRLWDGSTGQLRQIYRGGSRFLADATLTPDGLVIAGGADGLLRFWDATSGSLLWAFQAHKAQLIGVHVEGGDIVTRGFSGELSRWTLPNPEQVIGACSEHERCAIMHR